MDFTTYEPRISALEAGGGGGGDSDFSIAAVTASGIENATIYCANFHDAENPDYSMTYGRLNEGENQVILYKGKALLETSSPITTTGNIESVGSGNYIVSGDCAITIAG